MSGIEIGKKRIKKKGITSHNQSKKKNLDLGIECAQRSKEVLENAASVTIVADREGDIYEELVEIPDDKTDLVSSELHDRRLYDSEQKLFEHLSELEVAGRYDLEIKKSQKKRIPRIAKMEVRYDLVKIAKPSSCHQKHPEYVEIYVIEARESAETIPIGEDGVVF